MSSGKINHLNLISIIPISIILGYILYTNNPLMIIIFLKDLAKALFVNCYNYLWNNWYCFLANKFHLLYPNFKFTNIL